MVRPLLEIRPLPQPPPDLSDVAALAFTSVNGVAAFAALSPARDRPVFTVGDATAAAAWEAGFAGVRSADGALPDLARLIDASGVGPILVPGAREPAGDLSALVRRVQVRPLAVYAAIETEASPPSRIDAVLLHSARAARALAKMWPTLDRSPLVVALAEAVAEPIRPLTTLRVAARPTEPALLEALGNPPPRV